MYHKWVSTSRHTPNKPNHPYHTTIHTPYAHKTNRDLLPQYQGVASIEKLQFKRAVCNFFPTYATDSPLPTQFDRLCAIGDASGIQSPLSFGGLGSITRHLARLTDAFSAALETDSLTRDDLRLINAYQPSLSVAWLFQRSMSVPVGKDPSPHFILRTLVNNFKSMQALGDPVLRPFLQGPSVPSAQ